MTSSRHHRSKAEDPSRPFLHSKCLRHDACEPECPGSFRFLETIFCEIISSSSHFWAVDPISYYLGQPFVYILCITSEHVIITHIKLIFTSPYCRIVMATVEFIIFNYYKPLISMRKDQYGILCSLNIFAHRISIESSHLVH